MINKILNLAVFLRISLFFSSLLLINACHDRDTVSISRHNIGVVALTDNNSLLSLNSDDCSRMLRKTSITGLAIDEKMLSIDYRPATGQLYGVSNTSRLYVINAETGAARALGAGTFTPAINGSIVGIDFNPTVDRLRLVTNMGQNLRLNPETGTVAATDAALNPSTPSVSEVAYTNNKAGAATTTLYDIDVKTDKLYRQDPPNAGTLVEIGSLGVNAEDAAGFDITTNDIALAAMTVRGQTGLYSVNLTSGRVSKLGNFPHNVKVIGLAVMTEPVAYAVDGTNNLLIFNPLYPQPVMKPITGLQSGENILGLDMRPVNGQLYALGSSSRLYTINAASGVAAAVGTAPFATALGGESFGFDFNPTVDRIRIVSNTGQNLRAHPETGALAAVDGAINPGTPMISSAAYTNNFAGATTTTLYVLDGPNRKLYTQNPPNNGTLTNAVNLTFSFSGANGFDIGGTSGKAYILVNDEIGVKLYGLNLETGQFGRAVAVPTSSVRGFTLGLGF
jgi:Domain of unknown function (DUF4394)